MPSRTIVLTFPPRLVGEPVMYRLVKDFDLMINIVRASISPDEAGHMVVKLDGTTDQLAAGQSYLENLGVRFQPLSSDVRWREDLCVHCTACVTVCPTGALGLDRSTMRVSFDGDKCIGCELCIPVCSYQAVEMRL